MPTSALPSPDPNPTIGPNPSPNSTVDPHADERAAQPERRHRVLLAAPVTIGAEQLRAQVGGPVERRRRRGADVREQTGLGAQQRRLAELIGSEAGHDAVHAQDLRLGLGFGFGFGFGFGSGLGLGLKICA